MDTPMLWAMGFLVTFLFGGLTGIILSSPALDFHLSDSYFVVAHFHYTVFGTVVFAMFAGYYFWWPKLTGRMLDETARQDPLLDALHRLPHDVPHPALARCRGHGPALRRLPAGGGLPAGQHRLEPRCVPARRLDDPVRLQRLEDVAARRRWWSPTTRGATARSLEWATSCPPPRHNFTSLPRIRSERPAFDLHHPEAAPGVAPVADQEHPRPGHGPGRRRRIREGHRQHREA